MFKRVKFIIKIITISLIIFVNLLRAQNVNYAGTSVANFLKIGIGARAAGMGEAYMTNSSDAFCQFWNPGTISRISNTSFAFTSIDWLVNTNITYFGAVIPFSIGTFGLDIDYFGTGEIEETTIQEQEGTGRYFNASDMQIGLSYARNMTDRFSFGIKIKYLREDLAGVQANAIAFDVGSLFITNFYNQLRIGISLSNFGSKMQFNGKDLNVIYQVENSPSNKEVPAVLETKKWDLPLFFRLGISTDLIQIGSSRLTASLDILDSRDSKAKENLGIELGVAEFLFLRSGMRFGYDEVGYSFGGGINISKFQFDYAWTDFGRFNPVQQFSFIINL